MSKKQPTNNFEIIMGPLEINGALWKGQSACCFDDKTDNVCVITAPDNKQLKYFWDLIEKAIGSKCSINVSKTKSTIGNYDFIETKKECFWFYDRKNDRCFPRCEDKVEGCKKLGPCIKNTENECRILLRDIGWEREDIMEVEIDTIPW